MRRVYLVLTGLLLLAVLAQFYLAATGAFTKPQTNDSFMAHNMNGMMVLPIISILATIAAALAKARGRLIGMTILPLGLVLVQVLIVELGKALSGSTEDKTTTVGLAILGLHAINGLAIMAVSGIVFRGARMLASAPPVAATSGGSRQASATPTA
jgi:hypothetical protein